MCCVVRMMVSAIVMELLVTDGSQRMQVGCVKSLIFSYLASGIKLFGDVSAYVISFPTLCR